MIIYRFHRLACTFLLFTVCEINQTVALEQRIGHQYLHVMWSTNRNRRKSWTSMTHLNVLLSAVLLTSASDIYTQKWIFQRPKKRELIKFPWWMPYNAGVTSQGDLCSFVCLLLLFFCCRETQICWPDLSSY